jgi:hypothetical protein
MPRMRRNGSADREGAATRSAAARAARKGDALRLQPVDQRQVLRRIGAEFLAVGELAGDDILADRDVLDRAFVDAVQEVRISDAFALAGAAAAVDDLHEQDEREQDARPDEEALHPRVAAAVIVALRILVVVAHRFPIEVVLRRDPGAGSLRSRSCRSMSMP